MIIGEVANKNKRASKRAEKPINDGQVLHEPIQHNQGVIEEVYRTMTMNPQRRWEGAITNLNKGFKIDSKVGSYVPFPYLFPLLINWFCN